MSYTRPVLPPTVGEPADYNTNYLLYWNHVALDLNRLATSLFNAPNNDPPSASRALAIFHLAIHDAYFSIRPEALGTVKTYLSSDGNDGKTRLPAPPINGDTRLAVAGAAITVLRQLYTTARPNTPTATTGILRQYIDEAVAGFPCLNMLSPSYFFGNAVGQAMLNLLDQGPEPFDQGGYKPTPGRFKFDDDPTHPVRIVPVDVNNPNGPKKAIRVYSSPFYGSVAKRVAVQQDHLIGDPPTGSDINSVQEYNFAFQEVYYQGGAQDLNTTKRRPAQTTSGFFWAYDGANLIGTPPRHYNQILRKIAVDKKPAADITDESNTTGFVRLFALANAAQADAGIFSWLAKYTYELWRPLSGVRQDNVNPMADPFWLTQGAPNTNTNGTSFKPPFPAYPSGHATFGGAFFQAVRLYYKQRDSLTFADDEPDNISFTFISDELNGINRDLRQPYDPAVPITDQLGTVRTLVPKTFKSLWDAMFDNAISRVYLGVHWGFDAFAAADVVEKTELESDGTVAYKMTDSIKYATKGTRRDQPGKTFPLGGVPLGIEIANDIFRSGLKQAGVEPAPMGH
ncbi:MAG: hypothetical protein L6R42_003648 [Xanthoria sp. 1 TBL-2021]|nr:MAG: hypothetical protein L6R42_003648 [Xanthoria sp. 1 TBL-2021]